MKMVMFRGNKMPYWAYKREVARLTLEVASTSVRAIAIVDKLLKEGIKQHMTLTDIAKSIVKGLATCEPRLLRLSDDEYKGIANQG